MITPDGVAIMVPTTSNPRSIDAERAAVTVNGANVKTVWYRDELELSNTAR